MIEQEYIPVAIFGVIIVCALIIGFLKPSEPVVTKPTIKPNNIGVNALSYNPDLLNLILNLILIPKYGAIGAAWSTVFCEMLLVIVLYFQSWIILKSTWFETN